MTSFTEFNAYDGRLRANTAGCGCCSDGISTTSISEALKILDDHINELESDVLFFKRVRDKVKTTNSITADLFDVQGDGVNVE